MSVYVYLADGVEAREGFETKRAAAKNPYDEFALSGVRLWKDDDGRWYVRLDNPTDSIPNAVAEIVEDVSFREWIVFPKRREAGIYRYESAEAELDTHGVDGLNRFQLRIKAKNMEDLLALYRMIRIGSIRPEESYEGPQDGRSRTELEAAFERVVELDRRARDIIDLAGDKIDEVILSLDERKGLPFCSKRKVRAMLDEILAGSRKVKKLIPA